MRKQYTEPIVTADTTGWGEDRTVERHPSYAQIEVTRTNSSGDVALYGSHTGHRNYICLKIFVEYFGWYPTPSQLVTTGVVILFNYFSQRYFSFRKDKRALEAEGLQA